MHNDVHDDEGDPLRRDILDIVTAMRRLWDRGVFRSDMAAFENPRVTFVSRGRMQSGWQGTLDHHIRDRGGAPERRGTVCFYDMTIAILCGDAAMLVGSFRPIRPRNALQAINTRLFRRIGGRWVVSMNHVSSFAIEPRLTRDTAGTCSGRTGRRPNEEAGAVNRLIGRVTPSGRLSS